MGGEIYRRLKARGQLEDLERRIGIEEEEILGFEEKPSFFVDGEGLHIHTHNVHSAFPVVMKIRVE